MIDETAKRFTVAAPSDLQKGNPDILDFADARSCNLEINESSHELKRTVDGKSESYNPPKYEYSYNFVVKLYVDNPYCDDMNFMINNFSVKTGQHRMGQHDSNNDHLSLVGLNGLYWSSTSSFSAYLARSLGFDSCSFGINYNNFRNNGFSVRPVCK